MTDKFQKEAMRTNRELATENERLRNENHNLRYKAAEDRERLADYEQWFEQLGKFLKLDQFEIRKADNGE